MNNKFLSFGFPILLILGRPFMLLPDCHIVGVKPEYEHKTLALSKEESLYTFGPILEGVVPIGGADDLIGNSSGTALPLQSPSFQCFLDNGELAYGSAESPCFTLGTENIEEVGSGLIYS